MQNKKIVVMGLSGGMDSATLAVYYLSLGYQVAPLSFSYGSKHNAYERAAAEQFCAHYGMQLQEVELPFIGQLFKSNLLKTGGDIPEGHYNDASMSLTVVPGRNIIFASILAGYAWSIGAEIIALGVHSGDHAIYEDCRPEFIENMNMAVIAGTGGRVRIEAPFIGENKTSIVQLGTNLGLPYILTRTCYKDQPISCGLCGSCRERLEAFQEAGLVDPIKYEPQPDIIPQQEVKSDSIQSDAIFQRSGSSR